MLELELGWHGRAAVRALSRELDRHLAPAGLTSTQFNLLCLIASARRDTMGALAEDAGLDPSTLTRNIETLANAAWVEIVTTEKDRRKRAVWLTESGAFLLQRAIPLWRESHMEFSRRLPNNASAGLKAIVVNLD